ncbi:MAG TPA: ABC transporter permease [Polyangiaceae bacterium]|nr:ABC transporter permease [Polyangiaceae bacterium]
MRRARWRKLSGLLGWRLGLVVLGVLGFFGILAEWIAADVPVFLEYKGESYVLPALTHHGPFAEGARSDEIAAALGPGDRAVWPLFRWGPMTETSSRMAGASGAHPLGTDAFGRDVLARLVYGTRASLALGTTIAVTAVLLGFVLGCFSGALGGVFQGLIERFVEIVSVFPAVVAIALVRALEQRPSVTSLVIVVTAVQGASIARLTHVLVIHTLAEEFAVGAKAMGASPLRIAFRHVAPHLVAPLAVAAVFAVASAVLIETSLTFLDLGVPPTLASWGEMLGEIRWGAGPWIIVPPFLALAATVGALYAMADAVRRAFA